MIRAMRVRLVLLGLIALFAAVRAIGAETGGLKLDVMGEASAGTKASADVYGEGGKKVGQVAPGQTVPLAPGTYRLVLPIVGGKITKEGVKVEAGRTHTVLITNVAILKVSVKDRTGKDPGFGVTVTDTNPPHQKLAEFISGDVILIAPSQVDVKVDAPPQGYYWHAVELPPGRRAELKLGEVVPAELIVQPVLASAPLDNQTRVVVYKAGTQSQVAASDPGPEHRFRLDPGDYDVYVENRYGKGQPYVLDRGIHLDSGQKLTRKVPLDGQSKGGS
jgi:hypothetical protein